MTHTRLLKFIRQELVNNGIKWKNEQELFEMLIPDEPYEKYKTKWSSWKTCSVDYLVKSPYVLFSIQNTLGFDGSIWDANDGMQKSTIRKAVKSFAKSKITIDLSELIPLETPPTNEQKNLLKELKDICDNESETLLSKHPDFFKPTLENQSFLLEVLMLFYEKGMYDFLDKKIFPALLPHNKSNTNIKMMMAHTFGSLTKPRYLEAAKLLDTIESNSHHQLIDFKTAAISNVRRKELLRDDITKEELYESLKVLIHFYHDAFAKTEEYHYYPGVNLAYMVRLAKSIFPDQNFISEDLREIYKNSKPSITHDKSQNNKETVYYAWMSELEFMLLLDYSDITAKIYLLLDELNPSNSLIERTLRQMEFFAETGEIFIKDKTNSILKKIQKIIKILKSYQKN